MRSKERLLIRGEIFKTWKRKWQYWLLARLKTVSSLPDPRGHFPLPFLPCPSCHSSFPRSYHLQSHPAARGQIARGSAREGRMHSGAHFGLARREVDRGNKWRGALLHSSFGLFPSSLYRSFSLWVLTLLICVSDSSICLVHPSTDLPPRPLSSSSLTRGFLCCSPLRSWSHSLSLGFGPFVKPLVTFKLKWKKCVCIYCSIAHGGERSPGSLSELSVSSYRNIWQWG